MLSRFHFGRVRSTAAILGFGTLRTLALACCVLGCAKGQDSPQHLKAASRSPMVVAERAPLSSAEKQRYLEIARTAWKYFAVHADPRTGLVRATPTWANTTLWDIGGQLIAMHAARELGIVSPADHAREMKKVLATLAKAPLYHGITFHRVYSTETGSPYNVTGWSATDLGRFLVALKLIATTEPEYAADIAAIVKRNDFSQLVNNGYLVGQLIIQGANPLTFQEGRIGYEQYSAAGFNAWGANVANALSVKQNAAPVQVFGVPLFADKRFDDRLLSEPFILYGLELGLEGDYADLARNVLRAQEARYAQTGKLTIATEDAVSVPPDYFYYYCVFCKGKPFTVEMVSSGAERDQPRWVSTKGALGWDAIMPSDYTKKAVAGVAGALDPKLGWTSGVYEGSGKSTKTVDINTSAVLVEVAFYQLRGGQPLIRQAQLSLH
jgi:hypothetical protein